ncbi:hypothetical protein QL285_013271 [Trifolium repens]|nr:hypothetical protein QL285_013271 [Trifolium repens]
MTAILNVIPMKKRKQTIKRVSIFQNKNKNVINQDFKMGLHVTIFRAEGLDKFAKYHNVVYWIKPGEEIHTDVVEGSVAPEWYEDDVLMLDNLDDKVFLNVEVQRFNSLVDPGTSSGNVVVGRVKIPIPKSFYRSKVGSFHLIRSDENGLRLHGNILLSVRLQKFKPDSSPLQFLY